MDELIRLSYPLSGETPLYGGSGQVSVRQLPAIEIGGTCNTQSLETPLHAGTHIDFPRHFHVTGPTLDDFPP
ncbi:MAG: cyclase family protein, partial [Candidatus Wallbacteria bacterium]|nr:cyclase family protein [Candidatus Wallbacteria bacterium]